MKQEREKEEGREREKKRKGRKICLNMCIKVGGSGEMAQSDKYLSCKHEDMMSSHPSMHMKARHSVNLKSQC